MSGKHKGGAVLARVANFFRRALKVHADPINDAGKNVTRWPVESVLRDQRMKRLRNERAIAAIESGFKEGGAENKAYTLADLVHGIAQHADGNGGVVVEGVHGVVGNFPGGHSGSPVKPATVSACCASPRPDCMGMLVPGIGNRCKAMGGRI